ncbi:hypothetical protein HK101_009190 [Irineochytrium annulatum]|nr:hypothetical protein HK101_009190 [Irineochytrium annulatum]
MLLTSLQYVLFLLSALTTLYAFSTSRQYMFFFHPTRPTHADDNSWLIRSRNARIVPVELPRLPSDSDSEDENGQGRRGGRRKKGPVWWTRWTTGFVEGWVAEAKERWGKFVERLGLGKKKRDAADGGEEVWRWRLDIWDPREWALGCVVWFNPPTLYLLIEAFLDKLKDQEILFAEQSAEHQRCLSRLSEFKPKSDKAC